MSFFIGIAGPSGAGKTELAEAISERSNLVDHIYLDNYFKSPKTFPLKAGFKNWELPECLKFDMLVEHLRQLRKGKTVRATLPYYTDNVRMYKKIIMEPKPVVIAEGFLLLKDRRIRNLLDLKIYMEIPVELMYVRREGRFGTWISEYDKKVSVPEFLKRGLIQKKYADYVMDGSRTRHELVQEFLNIIDFHSPEGSSRIRQQITQAMETHPVLD